MSQMLLANKDVLLEPISYNEDILETQFYDKFDAYDTLDYTERSAKKTNHAGTKGTRILQSVF